MKFTNMAKAIVLSFTMLTGTISFAESVSTHRPDSIPSRPNYKTYANEDAKERDKICDSGSTASCCEEASSCCESKSSCCESMHEEGCGDMMGKGDSSEPSGDE